MSVRPYRDDDHDAVVALWQRVFPEAPPWNVPAEDIRRKLAVQSELFLVAEVGDELLGTAMAGYDGHRGWVYYLAVAPEHRGQGIGAALMAAVEEGLVSLGCSKLNLQVRSGNEAVVRFYQRLGFTVEKHISMGKRLDGSGSPPAPSHEDG